MNAVSLVHSTVLIHADANDSSSRICC